jgi:alanyl-tRNA synthetase
MLGNFSFGDYFKAQAIAWGWELSTQVFGISPENLVVSVFEEGRRGFCHLARYYWLTEKRIKRMGADDNSGYRVLLVPVVLVRKFIMIFTRN